MLLHILKEVWTWMFKLPIGNVIINIAFPDTDLEIKIFDEADH